MHHHAQLFLILHLNSLRLPAQLCFVNNISFCLLWHLPDQKSQRRIPYLAFSFSSSWLLGAVSIQYLSRISSFKLFNKHTHTSINNSKKVIYHDIYLLSLLQLLFPQNFPLLLSYDICSTLLSPSQGPFWTPGRYRHSKLNIQI